MTPAAVYHLHYEVKISEKLPRWQVYNQFSHFDTCWQKFEHVNNSNLEDLQNLGALHM